MPHSRQNFAPSLFFALHDEQTTRALSAPPVMKATAPFDPSHAAAATPRGAGASNQLLERVHGSEQEEREVQTVERDETSRLSIAAALGYQHDELIVGRRCVR